MSEAWIIDACRSPRGIGKPEKGALASMHPQHVAASVLKAIAARNAIDTAEVDDIIWGTSAQVGAQSGDLARMAALDAGYDLRASAVTLDRFCGSGITSVSLAAAMVMSGMEDLLIAGGTEMMSMPARRLGDGPPMMDSGNLRLRLSHPQSHQGVCADAIASLESIGRDALDDFSVESQSRAAQAIDKGYFKPSLVPVYRDDGSLALDQEEFPRPGTSKQGLAMLKPAFAATNSFTCRSQIGHW
ncbi:MAG: hypothetical protein EBX61_07240 [Betaproteobacteria bacterium]|nr:hypothetical protein [Betaproteobacteria bacterium]